MNKIIIVNALMIQTDPLMIIFDIRRVGLLLIINILAGTIALIFQRICKKYEILEMEVSIVSFVLYLIILILSLLLMRTSLISDLEAKL